MPIGKLYPGARFYRIVFVEEGIKTHKFKSESGAATYTRARRFYIFKCECGNTFEVWKDEWRGKRAMRDCGKCGLASRDGMFINQHIVMPIGMRAEIDLWRNEKGLNISAACVEILKMGMAVILEDVERLQKVRDMMEKVGVENQQPKIQKEEEDFDPIEDTIRGFMEKAKDLGLEAEE